MGAIDKIDYLLDEIVTLPSLPTTVTQIAGLVNDPDCALSDVGRVISMDPAIAMKTLRLVNSAFYGVRQKVTSVEHAVTLLGVKVIKNLVLTATVFDTFQASTQQFMRHCVACGAAMQALSETMDSSFDQDDAFVFGLLHDIGKVVFEEYLAKEYDNAIHASRARQIPLHEAEGEIIGVDHAEMGARLALHWKLPDTLVAAIAGHHELERVDGEEARHRAAMLSVADYACTVAGLPSLPRGVAVVEEETWNTAGVGSTAVPALIECFLAKLPIVDELIQLAA